MEKKKSRSNNSDWLEKALFNNLNLNSLNKHPIAFSRTAERGSLEERKLARLFCIVLTTTTVTGATNRRCLNYTQGFLNCTNNTNTKNCIL